MNPSEIRQLTHIGNKLQKMAKETDRLEDEATFKRLAADFDRIITQESY